MTSPVDTQIRHTERRSPGSILQAGARSIPAFLAFVIFAFGWSWGIGIFANSIGIKAPVLSTVLMMIAGFGPSLAGCGIVFAFSKGLGLRDWLARCLYWRIGWKWYALAFGLPPIVMVAALAIHGLLGGTLPTLVSANHIPLAILNFGLVFLVGGPLGEEFGWRGYALPALAAKLNWRLASVIVGVVWGLWHLPLFFMAASAQSHMPIAVFMLNILAGSIVFAWLFERTQQSVVPALILHTSLNGWTGILGIIPTAQTGQPYLIVTGLMVLLAVAMLLIPKSTARVQVH